jgi:hypothetical protein
MSESFPEIIEILRIFKQQGVLRKFLIQRTIFRRWLKVFENWIARR